MWYLYSDYWIVKVWLWVCVFWGGFERGFIGVIRCFVLCRYVWKLLGELGKIVYLWVNDVGIGVFR